MNLRISILVSVTEIFKKASTCLLIVGCAFQKIALKCRAFKELRPACPIGQAAICW